MTSSLEGEPHLTLLCSISPPQTNLSCNKATSAPGAAPGRVSMRITPTTYPTSRRRYLDLDPQRDRDPDRGHKHDHEHHVHEPESAFV